MSWGFVVAWVAIVGVFGLGLLIVLLRAASRGDARLEAVTRGADERRVARSDLPQPGSARTPAERERWTLAPVDPAPEAEAEADRRWTRSPADDDDDGLVAERRRGRFERRRLPR